MKRNVVRLMLGVAIALATQVALESQAEAKLFGGRNGGGLFNRNNGCCEQSCEPVCEPAPVCCEPVVDECGCNGGRQGRLFGGRRNRNNNCGCDSGYGAVVVPADSAAPPAPMDAAAPAVAPM